MLRLSNVSIYLALAVLAILIRCAAAAVVATAARCALASGAALMAPPLRARRSCRRRLRRRCCRHRVRWSLLMLVTRDPGDLALLALRVVAAAAAALYVPTTFASSPQRADPHAATHGVPTCPPQAHATAGARVLDLTRL